jgi:hypothetical protein
MRTVGNSGARKLLLDLASWQLSLCHVGGELPNSILSSCKAPFQYTTRDEIGIIIAALLLGFIIQSLQDVQALIR